MKIGIITDLHANLPALRAVLQALEAEGVEAIFHLGDAIAIGPHPRECVELLIATPNMHLIHGNHESYCLDGIPQPQPIWMSEGEVLHQAWVREQLGSALRSELLSWPWVIERELAGVTVRFQHYALDASGKDFAHTLYCPATKTLEVHFGHPEVDIVFYGHTHRFADQIANTRLINPGSLGCQRKAQAPYAIAEFNNGSYSVDHRIQSYDDHLIYQDFEERQVPERGFLYEAFYGGRFPPD